MARILITGAAGMIGSALARRLHTKNDLVLIDDESHGHLANLRDTTYLYRNEDICSPGIFDLFKDVDTVFHLAAISSLPECQVNPGEAYRVNVAGTANVLEACRRAGVRRLVFASTSAVYENDREYPSKEGHERKPPSLIYPLTKWHAEHLVRAFCETYGMQAMILRYYNVYGPQQDVERKMPAFVGYVVRELLAGRSPVLHGDGNQRRDYVYVEDVVDMNVLAMNHEMDMHTDTLNVASGKTISVNEICGLIRQLLHTNIKPIFRGPGMFWSSYPELYDAGYPLRPERISAEVMKSTQGNTLLALAVLGWQARTDILTGLNETIKGMRK